MLEVAQDIQREDRSHVGLESEVPNEMFLRKLS